VCLTLALATGTAGLLAGAPGVGLLALLLAAPVLWLLARRARRAEGRLTAALAEQHAMEERLRAGARMEAVGRLAAGIAHDFNNLLTVINGFGEMLRDGLPAGSPLADSLTQIIRAGERAAGLTRQLLSFSRKQVVAPPPLDLGALVRDVIPLFVRLLGEDMELVAELGEGLPAVQADAGQMEQVLLNLVVNARDAMPQGGTLTLRTGEVEVPGDGSQGSVPPGNYVYLAVADTGVGMTDEVKARIFEPFFTTKEPDKGTGLGLATVASIVRQSGGHVGVQSRPGQGSTFTVYLPSAKDEGGRRKDESESLLHPSSFLLHPSRGETVLLVEDEAGVRSLAREVLDRAGYRVLEATDGEEALALCRRGSGPIDLLITDVVMPRMSGSTLARRLAPLCPGMKVLFISGFTDSALVRHGVQSGEVECLLKPFGPEDLLQRVREVLDGSALVS
jgi:signal transduction histidine kinase/ActR/RegA family two-component response regulator